MKNSNLPLSRITSKLSERPLEFADRTTERCKVLNPEYNIFRDQPIPGASPLRINVLLSGDDQKDDSEQESQAANKQDLIAISQVASRFSNVHVPSYRKEGDEAYNEICPKQHIELQFKAKEKQSCAAQAT